jgi:hypothetical protein
MNKLFKMITPKIYKSPKKIKLKVNKKQWKRIYKAQRI